MSIWQKLFGATNTNNMQQVQVVAAPPVPPVVPETPKAPLDDFKDLWKTPDNQNQNQNTGPILDQEKVLEAAKNADFTKAVDVAAIQHAMEVGGAEGAKQLAEMFAASMKNTYVAATGAAARITDHTLQAANARMAETLPQHIRGTLVSDQLQASNAAFSNPALSPLVDQVKSQMQVQFPEATPAELAAKTQDYLSQMATLLNPQKQTTPTPAQSKASKQEAEEDWDTWFKNDE